MKYQRITYPDLENGEGVRVTLWVSGCSHHCVGCHNPETWDVHSGYKFTAEKFEELLEVLGKDYIDGLTLSGGDPLLFWNLIPVKYICKEAKKRYPHKTIWLYTGYTYEWLVARGIFRDVLKYVDVLVDGEFVKEERDLTLPFRGSRNQRIILVQESLKSGEVKLWSEKD